MGEEQEGVCGACGACVRVSVCVFCKDQKKLSDPLKMELQTVVSYLMWMLGTKFSSSGRAASVLNY